MMCWIKRWHDQKSCVKWVALYSFGRLLSFIMNWFKLPSLFHSFILSQLFWLTALTVVSDSLWMMTVRPLLIWIIILIYKIVVDDD